MEDYVSLSEVAEIMEVHPKTVRRWIKSGRLKAYKPGREYRIPNSALRAFYEESEAHPKGNAPQSWRHRLRELPNLKQEEVSVGHRATEETFGVLESLVELAREQEAHINELSRVAYQTPLVAAITVRNLFYETAESLDRRDLDEVQQRRFTGMCSSIEAMTDAAIRALDEGEAQEQKKSEVVPNNVVNLEEELRRRAS